MTEFYHANITEPGASANTPWRTALELPTSHPRMLVTPTSLYPRSQLPTPVALYLRMTPRQTECSPSASAAFDLSHPISRRIATSVKLSILTPSRCLLGSSACDDKASTSNVEEPGNRPKLLLVNTWMRRSAWKITEQNSMDLDWHSSASKKSSKCLSAPLQRAYCSFQDLHRKPFPRCPVSLGLPPRARRHISLPPFQLASWFIPQTLGLSSLPFLCPGAQLSHSRNHPESLFKMCAFLWLASTRAAQAFSPHFSSSCSSSSFPPPIFRFSVD